jgi:predicted ATP-dependent serine protease
MSTAKSKLEQEAEAKLTEAEQHKAKAAQAKAEAEAAHQLTEMAKLVKNAADLQHKLFDPMRWIVPEFLPEGLSMLAGKPKVGKSWLALDISIAVAGGGTCLGQQTEEGDVLLLALEDTERRMQRRITTVLGAYKQDWPKRLTYATAWPRLADGGIEFIRAWVKSVPKPRIVILDVLERVRTRSNKAQTSQYSGDYDALMSLHALASEYQLSVLVLHHQRKQGAEDLMDTVSGTLGIGGAVDTMLVLGKQDEENFLYGRGRDLEEFTVALNFDEHCRWQNLGAMSERLASDEREQIVAALAKHGGPMRLDEIAKAIDRPKDSIKMCLSRMHKDGELIRVSTGVYKLPEPELGRNGEKM